MKSLLQYQPRERQAVLGLMQLAKMNRGESTVSYGMGWQPIFHKSLVKNKKYAVYSPKGKLINFGNIRPDGTPSSQYKDNALGLYSAYDHNDKKVRDAYRARHSKITTKEGKLAYKDKEQPAYYSYNFLW